MNVARREKEMIKEVPTITIYIKCFGGDVHDLEVEDHHGVLSLHAFYVRFLLPLRIEVQCFAWKAGLGPDSLPEDAPG